MWDIFHFAEASPSVTLIGTQVNTKQGSLPSFKQLEQRPDQQRQRETLGLFGS